MIVRNYEELEDYTGLRIMAGFERE